MAGARGRARGALEAASRREQGACRPRPASAPVRGTWKVPSTVRVSPVVTPRTVAGTPCSSASAANSRLPAGNDRDERTGGGLAEQGRERVAAQRYRAAAAAVQAGLRQGDRQAAVGEVVGAGQHAGRRGGGDKSRQLPFGIKIGGWRAAAQVLVDDMSPRGPAELLAGRAEQHHLGAVGGEAGGEPRPDVVVDAQHADHRGRVDRGGAGLVVEADVAAGDRDAEVLAAVGEARGRPRRAAT